MGTIAGLQRGDEARAVERQRRYPSVLAARRWEKERKQYAEYVATLPSEMQQAGLAVELLETRHVCNAFKVMPVKPIARTPAASPN
jgi:hypothetical protein